MTNARHDKRHNIAELRRNIIKTMKWGREYTSSEIADRVGAPAKRVAHQMQLMEEMGLMQVTGFKASTKFYMFAEKERAA